MSDVFSGSWCPADFGLREDSTNTTPPVRGCSGDYWDRTTRRPPVVSQGPPLLSLPTSQTFIFLTRDEGWRRITSVPITHPTPETTEGDSGPLTLSIRTGVHTDRNTCLVTLERIRWDSECQSGGTVPDEFRPLTPYPERGVTPLAPTSMYSVRDLNCTQESRSVFFFFFGQLNYENKFDF